MSKAKSEISREDFIRQEKDGKKILVPKNVQLFLPIEEVVPEKTRKGALTHNSIVQKSKFLTYVPTGYTETEQNFMTLVLSNINDNDDELPDLSFSISDIADFLGVKRDRLYTEMPKTISNLGKITYEFPFEFDGELGYASMPFFSLIVNLRGKIICKINPNLKSFLLPKTLWNNAGKKIYRDVSQKQEITKYYAERHLSLKGKHTKRIYEILITEAYKDFPFKISLEDLRNILFLNDKYTEFREFKRNVLNSAEKEINEKSDIFFRYDIEKSGYKVIGLVFHIFPKPANSGLAKIKEELDFYGINSDSIDYIFNTLKISNEQVINNVEFFKKKLKRNAKIDNLANWLYCAIVKNYAGKSKSELALEDKVKQAKINEQTKNSLLAEIQKYRIELKQSIDNKTSQYIENNDKKIILDSFIANYKNKFSVEQVQKAMNKKNSKLDDIYTSRSLFSVIRTHLVNELKIDNDLINYLKSKDIVITNNFLEENFISRYC